MSAVPVCFQYTTLYSLSLPVFLHDVHHPLPVLFGGGIGILLAPGALQEGQDR